jgi:hypothetical protein
MKEVRPTIQVLALSVALVCMVLNSSHVTATGVAEAPVGAISGRVVDRAGGMPGVSIRARFKGAASDAGALASITGPGGAFELAGLQPGDYEIIVVAPGSETTTERIVRVIEARTTTVVIEVYRGCDTLADEGGSISKADENEVIRLAIEDAMQTVFAGADRHPILSTANLPGEFDVARIRALFSEVLKPEAIRQRASRDGRVWFFAVDNLHVRGNCVAVAIGHTVERSTVATSAVLLGGAWVMNEFRRISEGWAKRRVYLLES